MESLYRFDHKLLALQSPGEVNVLFEVQTPPPPGADERQPFAAAVVIDRSASMAGEPLMLAVQAAFEFVQRLQPEDEVALVTYDDKVVLEAGLGSPTRPEIKSALAHIAPGGSTNLSGGWLKGVEELRRVDDDRPRRVLLLTDGHANVGITSFDQLSSLAAGARGDSVTTSTIGLGDGFDEDLLTAMTDAGGGNAHHAVSAEDLPRLFARELDRLATLVAQNVSVEIRPGDDCALAEILHDYPTVDVAGGVQMQLGDCYGSEQRAVVFHLGIPGIEEMGPARVGEVVLRWTSVGDEVKLHERTVPLLANVASAEDAAAAGLDVDVSEQVTLLTSIQSLRRARDLADAGETDAAAALLESSASDVLAAPPGPLHSVVEAHADRMRSYARTLRDRGWADASRTTMTYAALHMRDSRFDDIDG
ncbi:MAG: VWA domain-containing protein [Acidimicrobiia bacterium]|nr:VWA domain-containing protein [Acidimicrobiia bacterium]